MTESTRTFGYYNKDEEFTYELIVEETDNGYSYGIRCSKDKDVQEEIRDISPDKKEVENMVRLFNDEQLASVHFADVVEDLLP